MFLSTREALLAEFSEVGVTLEPPTQALAVLPVRLGTEVFGTLTFNSPQPHPFGALERQFLEALATPLARILQRARVFEAEQQAEAALSSSSSAMNCSGPCWTASPTWSGS